MHRPWTRIFVLSFVSGLLLGAGARIAMRFVALEAGLSTGLSLGGSLEVVGLGAIVGAPAACLLFAFRSRVPLRRPWAGLFWAAMLFAALAAIPPPAARSALAATPDTPAATALAFAVLFAAWGLVLEWLDSRHGVRPQR
jgi:hypothetical protein